MKRIISVAAVVMLICAFSVSAFAVPYAEAEKVVLADFEDFTTETLLEGGTGFFVDFDDHSAWRMCEGFPSISDGGFPGKGLVFTPDYNNEEGLTSCVMRTKTEGLLNAAWESAYGFRFWVSNETDYDADVNVMLFSNAVTEDGINLSMAVGMGAGTLLIHEDGYVEDMPIESNGILIESGFKGWVVCPNKVAGGSEDDYDCGWSEEAGWSGTEAPFEADAFDFGTIYNALMDVRVSGFYSDDEGGIIFDNFELYGNTADPVDAPVSSKTEAPTAAPTAAVTDAPTEASTDAPTAAATGTPGSTPVNIVPYIAIAAGVVIIAVVIIIIVSSKKKKA